MMSLPLQSLPRIPFLETTASSYSRKGRGHSTSSRFRCRCVSELASPDSIGAVLHNKALVAAAVSAAIGQFVKPFTANLFYGKKFNLKAAARAGGFPSTHSSAAVAAATSLALERGLSDAIFGLAVVYAGLIMYDAQGVRRQVGIHAKELNKVILMSRLNSPSTRKGADDLVESFSRESSPANIDDLEEQGSVHTKPKASSLLIKSDDRKPSNTPFINSSNLVSSDVNGHPENVVYSCSEPLKESIGHTGTEVAAGAIFGFFVSLAIFPYV